MTATSGLSYFLAAMVAVCAMAPVRAGDAEIKHKLVGGDDSKGHVAIVNEQGEVQWEYKVGPIHDLHMLPNGNLLFQTDFQHIVEVSPDKKVVWQYDASKMNGNEGKHIEVHAFQRLADGTTMIAEGGNSRLIEVDKDGKITHEIKLQAKGGGAHSTTRLVRKLASGNYLVAHEADGAIREYDLAGTVVWEYEIPLFDKKRAGGHGVEAFGNQAYEALRLANGNTLISTGNGHSVLEVTKEKQIVWSITQDELPGIKLAWVTTLEVLPNGNIVFGNCHAGPENPQIVEVTHDKDKKVVWSFKDFKNFGNSFPTSEILVEGDVLR